MKNVFTPPHFGVRTDVGNVIIPNSVQIKRNNEKRRYYSII